MDKGEPQLLEAVYDTLLFALPNGRRYRYWMEPALLPRFRTVWRRSRWKGFNFVKDRAHRWEREEAPKRNPPPSPGEAERIFRRLGGDPAAADLKREYRRLSMQHHPDRGGDTAAFQDLQVAYEVLAGGGVRPRRPAASGPPRRDPLADFIARYPEARNVILGGVSCYARMDSWMGYDRQLHALYVDFARARGTFFQARAEFALAYVHDPDLRCGFFQQVQPGPNYYARHAAYLDYTPSTLAGVIRRFVAWAEGPAGFPTAWVEVDGKVVWAAPGMPPPPCPAMGRGHRWGAFQGPRHRRCDECGLLVDWEEE